MYVRLFNPSIMNIQQDDENPWNSPFTEKARDILAVFVQTALTNINICCSPSFARYSATSNASDMYNTGALGVLSADQLEYVMAKFISNLGAYSNTKHLLAHRVAGQAPTFFVFDCLHQFFLPARVRPDISGDYKQALVSKWITMMMALPMQQQFIDNYRNQYMPAYIDGYNYMMAALNGGSNQPTIKIRLCTNVFGRTGQESSPIVKFVRGYTAIILSLSKEIIQYFNPYQKKLQDEFPGYTNAPWIAQTDIMVAQQIARINELLQQLCQYMV